MKIFSVSPITGHRVEIEGMEWTDYTRYSANVWVVRMGESDEPIYNMTALEALEVEFQRFVSDKGTHDLRQPSPLETVDTFTSDSTNPLPEKDKTL